MARHAVCSGCGAPVFDINLGWVRNQAFPADRRVWFVCERCRDLGVAFDWSARGPKLRGYRRQAA